MKNFIIALELSEDKKKIKGVDIGAYPWNGIVHCKIENLLSKCYEFDNAEVLSDNTIYFSAGETSRYASYIRTDSNMKILKKSYVILAKASGYKGDMYFVTDGFGIPCWKSADELVSSIQKDGVSMANAMLHHGEDGYEVKDFGDGFFEVDYTSAMIEYRKYLKAMRAGGIKNATKD